MQLFSIIHAASDYISSSIKVFIIGIVVIDTADISTNTIDINIIRDSVTYDLKHYILQLLAIK